MLTDRTYLLFKPRNSTTSEKLNIKPNCLNNSINSSTYHRFHNNSLLLNSSNKNFNSLHHSPSFEHLKFDQYNSTPTLGRKFNLNLSNNQNYSKHTNLPKSRKNTYNNYNEKPFLYRSDSFTSTNNVFAESSGNMEKRKMLMSAFNRHTNTSSTNLLNYNSIKLNNCLNGNYVLPPRPSSNINYKKIQVNYTPTNCNYYNYLNYDDYFRPRIRERPLFSEIRKSIIIKSNQNYLYKKNFNKKKFLDNNIVHKSSVLSNGSSLSRSSSSSESLFLIQNESTTINSSNEISKVNSFLQSQKSVRKVDRFRSVIKFREHNIGKTFAERKSQINWNLDYDTDESILGILKNSTSTHANITNNNHIINNNNNNNDNNTNIFNTDENRTNLNNLNISSLKLSELNLNYNLINTNQQVVVNQVFKNKINNKLNNLNKQKNYLNKIKSKEKNLTSNKLKLYKSFNLLTNNNYLNKNKIKKSKSVKINLNKNNKQIITNNLIKNNQLNENKIFSKNIKKLIKTATKSFTSNKLTKLKSNKKSNNLIKNPNNLNINDDQNNTKLFLNKCELQNNKSSFIQPEFYIIKIEQELFKTEYYSLKPKENLFIINKRQKLFKTNYKRPVLVQTNLVTDLIKTNYYFITNLIYNPVRTEYYYVNNDKVNINLDLIKTQYFKIETITQVKSETIFSDLIKTNYFYFSSKLYFSNLITNLIKTEFFSVPCFIVSIQLDAIKTEYFKLPNIQIVRCNLNCLRTEYFKPCQQIFITELNLKNLDLLEYHSPLKLLKSNNNLNKIKNHSKLSPNNFSFIQQKVNKSSFKPNLSLNEIIQNDDNLIIKKKKKSIKITKITKVTKSVSSNVTENNKIDLEDNQIDLTHKNKFKSKQNLNENHLNTFHKHNAIKVQKYNRIIFRKYNVNDFNFQSVLGRGSFGKVFLAELIGHNVYFAIKCLKKNVVIEDNDVESTMIERKVLALGSSNPFICKLFCTFQTPSYLCFVMEYLAGGDLMFHVQRVGRFTEGRAQFYAAEIVCALKFLHRRYIIYRDLKLDNILLDKDGHIRLVDFGMCQCKIYRQECLPSNFCGTPDYMAPEIIKGFKYNHSVDWWSFGVLLYEMLIGKSPFTGVDEDELLWNVCNEKIIFPMFLSKTSVHIITLLLNRNPEKRLGMPGCPANEIYHQPFFDGINWDLASTKLLVPPFVPDITAANDISNFDKEFTEAEPQLTPIEEKIVNELDHNIFNGFSYTNPNMTD